MPTFITPFTSSEFKIQESKGAKDMPHMIPFLIPALRQTSVPTKPHLSTICEPNHPTYYLVPDSSSSCSTYRFPTKNTKVDHRIKRIPELFFMSSVDCSNGVVHRYSFQFRCSRDGKRKILAFSVMISCCIDSQQRDHICVEMVYRPTFSRNN